MTPALKEQIDAARERARIRREIRKGDDRIANQLDFLCDQIIALDGENEELYAKLKGLQP